MECRNCPISSGESCSCNWLKSCFKVNFNALTEKVKDKRAQIAKPLSMKNSKNYRDYPGRFIRNSSNNTLNLPLLMSSQLTGSDFLEGQACKPPLQEQEQTQSIIKRSLNPVAIIYIFILLVCIIVSSFCNIYI